MELHFLNIRSLIGRYVELSKVGFLHKSRVYDESEDP